MPEILPEEEFEGEVATGNELGDTVIQSEGHEDNYYSNKEVLGAILHENPIYLINKAADLGRFNFMGIEETDGSDAPIKPVEEDPEFDLNSELDEQAIPQEDRKYFEHVKNPYQFETTLEYYRQDEHDKEILNNTSLARRMALELVAAPLDPLTYITGGVARGIKFGSMAVRAAIAGAVYSGSSYGMRSATRNAFDAEELTLETAGGAIAGSFLHGLGVKVISPLWKTTKEAVKDAIMPNIDRWFLMENGVLKQAATGRFGTTVQKMKRAVWTMVNPTPELQMYNSGDQLLKDLAPLLFGNRISNLSGKGQVVGITASEKLNLYLGDQLKLGEKIDKLRESFIARGGTAEAFDRRVAKAIVRDEPILFDVRNDHTSTESEIIKDLVNKHKEIQVKGSESENYVDLDLDIGKAVKAITDFDNKYIKLSSIQSERYVITKELADMPREEFNALVKLDLVPKTKDTALRHIKRQYDNENIAKNIDKVRELLEREVILNNPELSSFDIKAGSDHDIMLYDAEYGRKRKEVESIVNEIIAGITGHKPNASDINPFETESFKVGLGKERQVAISDEVMLEMGMLKYDSVVNHFNSLRQLVVEQALDEAAQKVGRKDWRDLMSVYEHKQARSNTGAVFTKEARANQPIEKVDMVTASTEEAYSYNLKLLQDIEQLFKGTFSKTGALKNHACLNMVAGMRDLTFAGMSGQLFLSMIPDIATVSLRKGLGHTLERFSLPKAQLEKADKETLRRFLDFLDRAVQNNRWLDLGYVPDEMHTGLGRKLAAFQGKYSGVDWLTRVFKETVAEDVYSDIIDACVKNNNTEFLNKMGITEKWRKTIAETFTKYGRTDKSIKYFDPNYITDEGLSRQLRASIETLTNQFVMTPDVGNIPRFLRTEIGSFMYMFASYPYMLYNNVYRPLMRGDIVGNRFASALVASLALSTARKYIADYTNNRESNPKSSEFWKDTVNYSMLSNHIVDGIFSTEKSLTGFRSVIENISPTLAFASNLIRLGRDVTSRSGRERAKKIVRNMMPGFNLWWARPLTNPLLPQERRKYKTVDW